jgi:hypothetical protein
LIRTPTAQGDEATTLVDRALNDAPKKGDRQWGRIDYDHEFKGRLSTSIGKARDVPICGAATRALM